MKRVLLMPNPDRDIDLQYTKQIINYLQNRALLYTSDRFNGVLQGVEAYRKQDVLYEEIDFVIALGGDGMLLQVARESAGGGVPVLGINLGHLGFLSEVERHEIEERLDCLLNGDYTIEERMMLRGELHRDGGETMTFDALNDIVVARSQGTRLIDLTLSIDGEFVDDFRADGMIVATPTGSTAYSMSAGGPIVDPAVQCMLITPICPHKIYAKNIVIPDSKEITICVHIENPLPAMVTADGQAEQMFSIGDRLIVKRSKHVARLIRMNGNRFYSILHEKLLGKER
ncbi:MAG: NAD(+)/NADH kinase [Ruminococcaceae bacterium]|nr:NAD(+)/NADH kinase [Oscillospiraceae bacterium]